MIQTKNLSATLGSLILLVGIVAMSTSTANAANETDANQPSTHTSVTEPTTLKSDHTLNEPESEVTPTWQIRLDAELGQISVLSNRAQFSSHGTYLQYRTDGGQDNLYFFSRWEARLTIKQKHQLTFLLQPLKLASVNRLPRDLVIDDQTFAAGSSVRFTYGFPFNRVSYAYGLINNEKTDFYLGGSIQLRNATISFESLDGSKFVTNRDVGVVPIIKAYWEQRFDNQMWFSAEADGFYAPISYINGSDSEVVGAILDAGFRVGIPLFDSADAFLGLRYIGGGAVGDSTNDLETGDGYVRNWLHFGALTLGFRIDPKRFVDSLTD